MQEKKSTKDMRPDSKQVKTKGDAVEREYHFAGGGEYRPMSVGAISQQEAHEKWKKQRRAYPDPGKTPNPHK